MVKIVARSFVVVVKVISIPWMRQGFTVGTTKLVSDGVANLDDFIGTFHVGPKVPSVEFFVASETLHMT